MPSFQEIYQAAIEQDETAIQNFLLQDPACLNECKEQDSNLTVAEALAEQNQVEAVNFLIALKPDIKTIGIALAYARNGNNEAAEQFLLEDEGNHELANKLAWIYARAGKHEMVKRYINTHRVNPESVIHGYAEAESYGKAQYYFSKITDEVEHARVRDLLVFVYARKGNQVRAEYYVNLHEASPDEASPDKASSKIMIRGYVAGGHDDLVDAFLLQQPDYVDEAVWCYAFYERHDKVEEFQSRYPNLSRESIADGYFEAGDDVRAAFYRVPREQQESDDEAGWETYSDSSDSEEEDNLDHESTPGAANHDAEGMGENHNLGSAEEDRSGGDGEEEDNQNAQPTRGAANHDAQGMGENHNLGSVEEGRAESDGEEEENQNAQPTPGAANDDAEGMGAIHNLGSVEEGRAGGDGEDNLDHEPTPGPNNGNSQPTPGPNNVNSQPSNNQSWHGIDMQVLSLFVAGVGATAVAAAIVALALQAITLPVGLTIVTVGVVAAGLGGFGFFKYAPQAPAAPAAANAMDEQQQPLPASFA